MKKIFANGRGILLSSVIITVLMVHGPAVQAQTGWSKPYEHALIVTAEERATQAGLEILEKGGNAVDAAVAVQFALAVTLPRAGNIGGGGFMMVYLNDGTVRALDFREKAPAAAYKEMYLNDSGEYQPELSKTGPLAVGVPGTVDGMINALEYYGRLPLEVVMEPAIRLAEEGYTLSYTQANELNRAAGELRNFDSSSGYFLKNNDSEWSENDVFIQQDLAETLRRIARSGRRGFYTGITAQRIVQEIRNQGGVIDYEDLRTYQSKWREPITTEYAGYQLHLMPPPSSGGVVISQVLGMLNSRDLAAKGYHSADYVHLLSEAMRRSFADSNYYLGDPDYTDIPLQRLINSNYLSRRFRDVRENRATNSRNIAHGRMYEALESIETTHFSILDQEGNAVAVTTTLNGDFGSKLAVSGAGFLLNNDMDNFSDTSGIIDRHGLSGTEANSIEPGKRMLSNMTPAIVTRNGEVRMVLGGAGGSQIITSVIQTFLNLVLFDMNAREAISAPRFHHQWLPDEILTETRALSPDTEHILTERGHTIHKTPSLSRIHLVWVEEDGLIYGEPDPRGNGVKAGY